MFDPRLTEGFRSQSFPCNPVPFALGLAELVREKGTAAIQSPEAKSLLLILIQQSYGQCCVVDAIDEYSVLDTHFGPATE